jgi:hypothetical protein
MSWRQLSKTVARRDAGIEPPGMTSRRVLDRCHLFMSRAERSTPEGVPT